MKIPFDLPYMGCKPYKEYKVKFPCLVQMKLNGIDARYYQGKFYTRENKTWSSNVVSHLVDLIELYLPDFPEDIMLHGQFYRHGWSFGRHISAINVNLLEPVEDTKEIGFSIYDWWRPECDFNMFKRQAVIARNNYPLPCLSWIANSFADLDSLYNRGVESGYEGIVVCNPDGKYLDGKTWDKMKKKKYTDHEFLCIGVEHGKGRLSDTIGALVCRTPKGDTFKVGTGMTDKERAKFMSKSPIGKPISVRYQELSEDDIPLCPVYLAIRDYE